MQCPICGKDVQKNYTYKLCERCTYKKKYQAYTCKCSICDKYTILDGLQLENTPCSCGGALTPL